VLPVSDHPRGYNFLLYGIEPFFKIIFRFFKPVADECPEDELIEDYRAIRRVSGDNERYTK